MRTKKKFPIIRKKTGEALCQASVAQNSYSRILGLMFKKNLPQGEGLLLIPCNSIHTFFMRFPIDVIFLDKKNRILATYTQLVPWRATKIFFRAKKVLEVPGGTLPSNLMKGEELSMIHE